MNNKEIEDQISSLLQADSAERLVLTTVINVLNADLEGTSQGRNKAYFIADRAYEVESISEVHDTAMTSADGAALQIAKATGTVAPLVNDDAYTSDLLTDVAFSGGDNIYRGFNLKGVAANVVTGGTLTNQVASLRLASGNRLVYGFNGTLSTTYIQLRTVLKKV